MARQEDGPVMLSGAKHLSARWERPFVWITHIMTLTMSPHRTLSTSVIPPQLRGTMWWHFPGDDVGNPYTLRCGSG
jgi:hypothetical protein